MSGSAFVVELTGARGVGKSTLAALIAAEFEARGVPLAGFGPLRQADRFRFNIAAATAELRMLPVWRTWHLRNHGDTYIMRRRLHRYLFRLARFSRESGVLLLEEGIFQLMMMIAIRTGRDAEAIASSLSTLVPMPDLVVSVEAPEAAIDARRKERGNAGDVRKPHMSIRSRDGLRSMQGYIRSLAEGTDPRSLVVENIRLSELRTAAAGVVDEIMERIEVPRRVVSVSSRRSVVA